jgi:hypothetical protein
MDDDQENEEPTLVWNRPINWPPPGWDEVDSPDMQMRFPEARFGQMGLS